MNKQAYVVAAIVDSIAATARRFRPARIVTKTALMPALAAASPPRDLGMAIGLAGSWAGDIALLGDSDRAFRTGLTSFLVAHLGYTTALARRSTPDSRKAVVPIVAASSAAAFAFARAAGPLARAAGPLGRPVGLYALTLGTMVAAASSVRGPGARRIFTGAALFAVSDSLLGASRFVLTGRAAQVAAAGVMPTYAAAQWLIHTGFEASGDPA